MNTENYVIVRSDKAGVFFGILVSQDKEEVVLKMLENFIVGQELIQ